MPDNTSQWQRAVFTDPAAGAVWQTLLAQWLILDQDPGMSSKSKSTAGIAGLLDRVSPVQREAAAQILAAVAGYAHAAPFLANLTGASAVPKADEALADTRRALEQWFWSALAMSLQPRSLTMPSVAAGVVTDGSGGLRAVRRLARASMALARSLLGCAEDAVHRFEADGTALASAESPAARHARWLDHCDGAYRELLRSARYSRRVGRFVNAASDVLLRMRGAASALAPVLGLTTRADFEALANQVAELRRIVEIGTAPVTPAQSHRPKPAPRAPRKRAR